ncbi:MAG: DUF6569 family protein [Candidatus Latescibacterota bacterium]
MSSQFARSLARHLEQLVIGPPLYEPQGHLPGMVAYPVFPGALDPDPPELVTLSEALRRGLRVRDMGLVSRIHVDNPLPVAVLAGESEVLLGPTQGRAVQFSCLLPPQRRSSLPVSCVQEGRPTEHLAEFADSDACPWSVRTAKLTQMALHGEPQQYWLWDRIASYLQETGTHSPSHDLHAVLERYGPLLQRLGEAFPCFPGQVGVICAVGHEVFLELFGDPEILEDRYPLVLRSALVEAVARPADVVPPPEQVPVFLQQVVAASQESRLLDARSLKTEGRPLVFASPTVAGSALVAHGRLVHLAARQQCPGISRPAELLQGELEALAARWTAVRGNPAELLQAAYAPRRARYQAHKDRLRPAGDPVAPAPRAEPPAPGPAEPGTPPTRPLPLSQPLYAFFLRLFSRG